MTNDRDCAVQHTSAIPNHNGRVVWQERNLKFDEHLLFISKTGLKEMHRSTSSSMRTGHTCYRSRPRNTPTRYKDAREIC
jgi:hypothetical protein